MWNLLALLLGAASLSQANRQYNRQHDLAQQQYQQSLPTPQEQAMFDQMNSQLLAMLDPSYSAVPQTMIEQVIASAGRDIGRAQEQASERALSDLARRGLAGSSLVDQANVRIGERANEALADARIRTEMDANRLTQQVRGQAMQLSSGLSAQNAAQRQNAFQSLVGQAGQAGDTFAQLGGTVLAPQIGQYLYPEPQQPQPQTYWNRPTPTQYRPRIREG